MNSYFEIGGLVVTCSLDSTPSPYSSRVSGGISMPSWKSRVGSGDSQTTSDRTVIPYTGIGNPVTWLGTHVLLKGARVLMGFREAEATAY